MSTNEQLENYVVLLRIRQNARRRDTVISGGLFLVTLLGFLALGLLGGVEPRSAFLMSGLLIAFGLSFVTTWVRLEIARSLIEFVSNLQVKR